MEVLRPALPQGPRRGVHAGHRQLPPVAQPVAPAELLGPPGEAGVLRDLAPDRGVPPQALVGVPARQQELPVGDRELGQRRVVDQRHGHRFGDGPEHRRLHDLLPDRRQFLGGEGAIHGRPPAPGLGQGPGHGPRPEPGVRVHEQQPLPPRRPRPLVQGPRLPQPPFRQGLPLHQPQADVLLRRPAHDLPRPVLRAVVHHQHLQPGEVLAQGPVQAGLDHGRLVAGRDDDRDGGGGAPLGGPGEGPCRAQGRLLHDGPAQAQHLDNRQGPGHTLKR